MRLSQVRFLVDDFGESFRFYRDVLGLPVGFGEEGEPPYASFTVGDGAVAIFERSGQEETVRLRAPGDGTLLVLEVDDVDAEAARLGDHVLAEPVNRADWGGRVVYVRDPSGNLVELFQQIPMEEG
jgi:catechol 2,3-dioxygenase-like lactoylglutathione lyase family enzyme